MQDDIDTGREGKLTPYISYSPLQSKTPSRITLPNAFDMFYE